jgi:pseudouridine-5'-phosphate glycosidase
MRELLHIAEEVAAAVEANKPVLALESTVISHGLPRPVNLETAQRLESIVRTTNVVPATIAIIDGKLCVGLNNEQLKLLAEDENVMKISTRDIPLALARNWTGATTVAATSWIAERAGIKVFSTGGIGGVHRGSLPDISADLPELARTPIVVVCSGAKIVLDLPATREWLETHGVTVIGYQCAELPAFYSRSSGLAVDARVESAEEVSEIFRAQRTLQVTSALLVTVPVPEEFEVPPDQLTNALDNALAAAEEQGIGGRELTPFLLSRMAQQSEGATLKANIALLEHNVRVGAEIAHALAHD